MDLVPILIFLIISVKISLPNEDKKMQDELPQSKQPDSLITKSDIDNVSMNEGAYSLMQGEKKIIDFNKPYGLILMRSWDNIILEIFATNPKTGKKAEMQSIKQGGSKIGVYLGEYTGQIVILATKKTYVSYAQIDFPKDCDHRFISNTLTRTISLKGTNYLDGSTFCYFNTAKLPITYTFNYSLGSDNLIVMTNSNEDINATKQGYFDKTLTVPAFIKVITGKDIKKNHFVKVKMSSINDEKPIYKFSGFVNSESPMYLVGEKKKGSKLSSSTIATFVVAGVIFFALVVYAFSYLCLSHKHKHHRHNRHNHNENNNNNNNGNNNNNTGNTNNNNNNGNTNANNPNNNENPDENAEEKELIENGRYKTPAHVNIELISSQFDPKYKSSNPNMLSRKSSSHFDNDTDLNEEDIENNGYPLNEYKPPSKGILAPTSISQFSEDVDPDEAYEEEDKDMENMKEAPFRKSRSSISQENDSDSDSDSD